MASSWEKLATITQPSDSSTLTTPLFTAKTHLKVIAHTSQSTPVEPDIRFGFGASGTIDDNSNRYAVRLSLDGGGELSQYNNLDRNAELLYCYTLLLQFAYEHDPNIIKRIQILQKYFHFL